MTHFTTPDRDSSIPNLAALDWERREVQATQREAAEKRQQQLLEAVELAPHVDLHRLPQNFWVAVILPSGEMPTQSEPASGRVGEPYTFASEIDGCTDLHHITGQVLFFRSNLSEAELRDNIDLSFLPF